MADRKFKVSFTLDEDDAKYFRDLFRVAKKNAAHQDEREILAGAHTLVKSVRKSKKTPGFVLEAIETLEDLTQLIVDEDYRAPKSVRSKVLGALAYFSSSEDLISDDIPVLGFLDDAIMIKFVEDEFQHEIVAYRKFRRFRDGAEQRPWTKVAGDRLPGRLDAQRNKARAEVERRTAADEARGRRRFFGF